MAASSSLMMSAQKAYGEGRFDEAKNIYRLAIQAAKDENNPVQQFEAMAYAAISESDPMRMLSALLDVRLLEQDRPDVSFPDYESWVARKYAVECRMVNPVSLSEIQESLEELEQFACNRSVPKQDLHVLRGNLAVQMGKMKEALARFEAASAEEERGSGGYSILGYGLSAANCAIRMANFGAAEAWVKSLARVTARGKFSKEFVTAKQDLTRFTIARAAGNDASIQYFIKRLRSVPTGKFEHEDELRLARFWGAIARNDVGDPIARDHPARRSLARLPEARSHLPTILRHVMAILDYRLACLRYCAGIMQNDDQWAEAEPPSNLKVRDRVEVLARLARARHVQKAAMRRATYLDSVFECDWRFEDIEKRRRAIDAIADALA